MSRLLIVFCIVTLPASALAREPVKVTVSGHHNIVTTLTVVVPRPVQPHPGDLVLQNMREQSRRLSAENFLLRARMRQVERDLDRRVLPPAPYYAPPPPPYTYRTVRTVTRSRGSGPMYLYPTHWKCGRQFWDRDPVTGLVRHWVLKEGERYTRNTAGRYPDRLHGAVYRGTDGLLRFSADGGRVFRGPR